MGLCGVVATFEMKVKVLVAVPSARGSLLSSRQQATTEACVGRMLAIGREGLLERFSFAYRSVRQRGGSGREETLNHYILYIQCHS